MPWPTLDDFNEAVQDAEIAFADEDLRRAEVELTPLGLPKVASGNFACVYRLNNGGKSYAAKCFLRNMLGQHQRYSQLSQFVLTTPMSHMVDFEYQLQGIQIDGSWYPIVKMDWIDGPGLDLAVRKNWSNKAELERITSQFCQLMTQLQEVGVAHCDLQHGNILVKADGLKLVDYDGMFVPSMQGASSNELGHSNYQHPQRSSQHFGTTVDDFSAWIIYYSLCLLKLDPSLWQRHTGGEDCLLFRKADFADPRRSRLLTEIATHPIPAINALSDPLINLITSPIEAVPRFGLSTTATVITATSNSQAALATSPNAKEQTAEKPVPVYPSKWPRIDEYFLAATKPKDNFSDDRLKASVLVPTSGKTTTFKEVNSSTAERLTSTAVVIKGQKHVVVRMAASDDSKQYAVKFFLHDVLDRHTRYDAIHRLKKNNSNRYFVPFVYQAKGILVDETWFPILKMLWISGVNLEDYVKLHLGNNNYHAVEDLVAKFDAMLTALHADGIAHGDLDPTNILVDEGDNLRIVDYDAMYVPPLAHLSGCESGNPAYQHPSRKTIHFGPYLDNYPAIQIYGMLRCLYRNPPASYWSWDELIRQNSMLIQMESSPKMSFQKKPERSSSTVETRTGWFAGTAHPMFGQTAENKKEVKVDGAFEEARQRLAKILKVQRMKRIDQVDTLTMTSRHLF